MAWVAVDKDGTEWEYIDKPKRHGWLALWVSDMLGYSQELEKGSIEKLIGRKLTWEDEPVELRGE